MVFRSGKVGRTGPGGAARRSAGAIPGRAVSSSLAEEAARLTSLCAEEDSARRAGTRAVAGVDEVGRGALAGPVVAAAVVLDRERVPRGLDDSKALLPEVREDLARRVRRDARAVGVGEAAASEVDRLGIAPATALAMRRALGALPGPVPDLVLVDGYAVPGLGLPQKALVKGDARVAAIAAASVVAKVHRDRILGELDGLFPHFGFAAHKGYGTPEHLAALRRHGPSPVHRLTFDRVLPSSGDGRRHAATRERSGQQA